jgi:sigma-B regulation protein RsbU (phosphoserine phosphatase)
LSDEQVVLVPGDKLILYTDGLTDVVAPDGRLYDLGQFTSLLLAYSDLGPEALCEAIYDGLDAYRGTAEQYDDMTMLVLGIEQAV